MHGQTTALEIFHLLCDDLENASLSWKREGMQSEYGDVIYFTEVRWLSRGNVLMKFFELIAEVKAFVEKDGVALPLIGDPTCLMDLDFLVGITHELNILNKKLQGRVQLVSVTYDNMRAFCSKLVLWKLQLSQTSLCHFKSCTELVAVSQGSRGLFMVCKGSYITGADFRRRIGGILSGPAAIDRGMYALVHRLVIKPSRNCVGGGILRDLEALCFCKTAKNRIVTSRKGKRRIEQLLKMNWINSHQILQKQNDLNAKCIEPQNLSEQTFPCLNNSNNNGCYYNHEINESSFQCLTVLGTGAYGKVILVRKTTGSNVGQLYAMKVLTKYAILQKAKMVEHVLTERTILEAICKSKFFVTLHYAFQSERKLHLVMDYVSGGELFTHLQKHRHFKEDHVQFYMGEMILALDYLHNLKIIYRDLKLENVMLNYRGHVVLTDFGLSKIFPVSDNLCRTFSFCGTIEYMAPEIINIGSSGYTFVVDWWSLGVLTFELIVGKSPFAVNVSKRSQVDIADRVLKGPIPKVTGVSAYLRDLISRLMIKSPSKRLGNKGSAQICGHPFFKELDWFKLENHELPAPIVPILKSDSDTRNFLKEFTVQSVNDIDTSPIPKSSRIFLDYEYQLEDTISSKVHSSLFICQRPRTGQLRKLTNTSNFFKKYELLDKGGYFGEGTHSICRKCLHRGSGTEYAVKILPIKYFRPDESILLSKLQGHPCVVNFIEFIEDNYFIYTVMEQLEGGELLQRLLKDNLFRLKHGRTIITTIVYALRFMHTYSIVHGNFRPEKILLLDDSDIPNIKIVGLDSYQKPSNFTYSNGSNVETIIPANNFRKMLESFDWWGVGMLMYVMVNGCAPNMGTLDLVSVTNDQIPYIQQQFDDILRGLLSDSWQIRATAWDRLMDGEWLNAISDQLLKHAIITLVTMVFCCQNLSAIRNYNQNSYHSDYQQSKSDVLVPLHRQGDKLSSRKKPCKSKIDKKPKSKSVASVMSDRNTKNKSTHLMTLRSAAVQTNKNMGLQ
ncbi:hypothetical protein GJ496_008851 [Pomphorhynchus laevis]|nr:hypothetical protein GJ496_008851 [Pomphorhynchus laevis]